jgi:putative transposase
MVAGLFEIKCPRLKCSDTAFDVEDLVANAPAQYLELHDRYDHAQGSPHPWAAVFRAHVLRLVKGYKHESALCTYLDANPALATELGFESVPDQSTLWRAWENRFTEDIHEAIRTTAEVAVEQARRFDAPAPSPDFLPEDKLPADASEETKAALAREKAQQVWQSAKPFVTDCFKLDRAQNASIPESAWWEQHAFMGMREDMCANGGAKSFALDSTRQRTPSGDSHRHQLKQLAVEDVRDMLRKTTRQFVARARSQNELQSEVMAAIDITKGHPWTGHVQRDSSGELKEPWILGYKDGELYFQWAVIKIVGLDIPFVLDAVPVVRNRTRADIVDDLLEGALSVLPDISTVLMDREFDADGVKPVCEQHDVYYLNPTRIWKRDEHGTQIQHMEDAGEDFAVVEQTRVGEHPPRKAFYLPKREWERPDDDTNDDDSSNSEDSRRQELIEEFADGFDVDDAAFADSGHESVDDDKTPFESLVADVAKKEELPEPEKFDPPTVAFETNHPLVESDPADEREMKHQIGRMMAKYKRRWGIENGFKKIKKFLCRTTSKDHEYRYFNFAFACVLYNCWRIVDLLVQLSLNDDPTYTPEIDAHLFLTLAKQEWGLDPPD